jgi:hypothetical protein
MATRSIVSAVAFLLFAVSSSVAVAQPSTGEVPVAPGGHRVSAELDFFHEAALSPDFAVLSPAFYGRFRLIDTRHGLDAESGAAGIILDLDVKWRGAGLAADGDGTFRMGNPYVGARAGLESSNFTFRGGLGITLPFTNLYDDGGTEIAAYGYALSLHGVWDPWLALPQSFAVVIPVDIAFRTQVFTIGADSAFAVIASLPKAGDANDPYIALQLGAYGAFTPIPLLSFGLRFQMVLLANTDGGTSISSSSEEGYLALVPFVRLNLEGGFVETRLYMNLDDPFGFAFDSGRVWALSFSGGVDF